MLTNDQLWARLAIALAAVFDALVERLTRGACRVRWPSCWRWRCFSTRSRHSVLRHLRAAYVAGPLYGSK